MRACLLAVVIAVACDRAAPAPPPAPPAESILARMPSWRPGRVCTCGFVQSFSRPTADVHVGTIFVSEKPGIPRDDEVRQTAVCWWSADGPATGPAPIHDGQRVCVEGVYDAPAITDCRLVPACGH